ncbi:MAG: C39 family peptidase [Pseudomonadales bacterium]|jgi:predicted double-glycine peptidase
MGKVFVFALASTLLLASASVQGSTRPVSSVLEMRQQNVILQRWELSCAAAALATVLRYQYGVPATERSVALGLIDRPEYLANPDLVRIRQGFSLLDLKRYVDSLGYEGIGLGNLTLDDLLARAPVIVPVSLRGYPHFVVFRGATQREVLLADPAFGNVTMSIPEFMHGWIVYRDFGRTGFVVTESGNLAPGGRLSARSRDFAVLR